MRCVERSRLKISWRLALILGVASTADAARFHVVNHAARQKLPRSRPPHVFRGRGGREELAASVRLKAPFILRTWHYAPLRRAVWGLQQHLYTLISLCGCLLVRLW